jgi:hypothetical protein
MQNISFEDITVSTRYYNQTWWGGAEPIYVTATPRTPTTKVRAGPQGRSDTLGGGLLAVLAARVSRRNGAPLVG